MSVWSAPHYDRSMATSRVVLGVVSALALVLCGCGSDDAPSPDADRGPGPATSTAAVAPGDTTLAEPAADPIPLREAVGQMIVTRYLGPDPTPTVLAALREGRAGGIMLYADNVPSKAVARRAVRLLVRATDDGGHPRPLILIDQEGGDVKRLKSIPPDLSGAEIGAARSPAAEARRQGQKTGRALRSIGVNVNLAPLADVPDRESTFLRRRPFSRSPTIVARAACGFVEGQQGEGVSATLKHFPGLGRAGDHTDTASVTVDVSASAISRDLAAYERCGADVDVVMLSSAIYPSLGIDRPAVLDPRTYRLLAGVGFIGLTVSDALDTASFADVDRPALQAARAGLDVLLYSHGEEPARLAFDQLRADVRAGRLPRERVEQAARRILDFKARQISRRR